MTLPELRKQIEEYLELEKIEFETTWGQVKCHDETHVWFPRFFGDGIASKIKGRETHVSLTFKPPCKQSADFAQKLNLALDVLERTQRGIEMWRKYQSPGNIAQIETEVREALDKILGGKE